MAIYEMEPYEFNVTDTLKDENGDYHISLKPIHFAEECPYCGSENIIRFGSKAKAVRDIPMFGGRVELLVNNPRYKCKECDNSFFNTYHSIEDGKRMTNRLREYIRKQSLLKPFSVLGEELGISDTAVKNIFSEYVAELDSARELKAPRVLGIDEESSSQTVPRSLCRCNKRQVA